MNIEEFRSYCLAKKGVTESFPFDEKILVFKVLNKMFALSDVSEFRSVNLKCHPEKVEELREEYEFVQPGYHMNKHHWNTVFLDWQLEDALLRSWIDDSYDLIVASLSKKKQEELENL